MHQGKRTVTSANCVGKTGYSHKKQWRSTLIVHREWKSNDLKLRPKLKKFTDYIRVKLHDTVQFSSVQSLSRDRLLWPHESQHTKPPCPSTTPGVHSDSCPLSQWCHPAISSSVDPFSSSPNPSQHQSLFQWVNSSHEVAKVLEYQSFQWTPRTDL